MAVPTEEIELGMFGGVLLDIERALRDADYTELMQDMLPILEREEARAFSSGTSPGGTAWQQNATATIKRKGHGIILVDSRRLDESLASTSADSIRETAPRGLVFGTSVPYAAIHQFGTARIPQREHVGMGEETCNQLVDMVANYTVELLKSTV